MTVLATNRTQGQRAKSEWVGWLCYESAVLILGGSKQNTGNALIDYWGKRGII